MEISARLSRILMPSYFLSLALAICAVWGNCNAEEPTPPRQVNLVDLLAQPDKYLGEQIAIIGYLTAQANLMLFVAKEYEDDLYPSSGIVVGDHDQREIYRSGCLDRDVVLIGQLYKGGAGDFSLVDVNEIINVSNNEICWRLDEQ